jgi:hypothetical protein
MPSPPAQPESQWIVLVDTGFRFTFECTVAARTAQEARKKFLHRERGTWKAEPARVRVSRVIQ